MNKLHIVAFIVAVTLFTFTLFPKEEPIPKDTLVELNKITEMEVVTPRKQGFLQINNDGWHEGDTDWREEGWYSYNENGEPYLDNEEFNKFVRILENGF